MLLVHEPRARMADGGFKPWMGVDDIGVTLGGVHGGGTSILYAGIHAGWVDAEMMRAAFERGEWDPDAPQPQEIPARDCPLQSVCACFAPRQLSEVAGVGVFAALRFRKFSGSISTFPRPPPKTT